jgi:hypothetical protein
MDSLNGRESIKGNHVVSTPEENRSCEGVAEPEVRHVQHKGPRLGFGTAELSTA